ncbi:free fatty acid receptor 2-like [Python bivittatus]|uniref:Free fatty acid receptor 2-like n=1 Tax=Python bivittatus TaxID=176946 RepID=A0A9F2WJH9_PYTBI|nr:free fatty acid receptor 2-like [Python bivittatus]
MSKNIVVLIIYIIAFLAGLPCNLLACYSFLRKVRQKPVPIDILLLNLTFSDLFLLIFLPFKMAEVALNFKWPLSPNFCPVTNFFFYSSIYLSTLFLMGVSIERYLCIAHPVKHKLNRRPTYAKIASLFFWFLACAHCGSIVFVVHYFHGSQWSSENNVTCYKKFSPQQLSIVLPFRLELFIVLFFIPFIVTVFCYVNVIRILTNMPNIKPQKRQRAVGLAIATMLNFTIAFAPYNISHIVGFVKKESPTWRTETFCLTSLNTVLDPVIFFFSSSTIRRTFTEFWIGICNKLRNLTSRCCPCCCKSCRDNAKEGRAGELSVGNLPSILAGSSTPSPFLTLEPSGTLDG